MKSQPITHLQVLGVRYSDSRFAENDERCVDAYAQSNVYASANVPFTVVEPEMPEDQRIPGTTPAANTDNIGLLGGEIANAVASARAEGRAVLMTGGNCSHITGMFGGLQDAHGPTVRVGLVWFDAHGDFNTPKTTLSGMLGGMPVAVCAGLAYPRWREYSHMVTPLPTDRIIMVDVRNLDEPEAQLINATDVVIVPTTGSQDGNDLATAVNDLADRCDLIYLHIDSDILDESLVPNHGTREPDGPDMAQVQAAIDTVMATGKVGVAAVVSVYGGGDGREISVGSGIELVRGCLAGWLKYGGVW
ncbi:MAG: arginase family protein [Chloroflexota bacterium]